MKNGIQLSVKVIYVLLNHVNLYRKMKANDLLVSKPNLCVFQFLSCGLVVPRCGPFLGFSTLAISVTLNEAKDIVDFLRCGDSVDPPVPGLPNMVRWVRDTPVRMTPL